jgi:hypothetical protein
MDNRQYLRRLAEISCRETVSARDDEHVVLRLAREALRSDPPSVRFVGRLGRREPQRPLPGVA